MTEERLSGGCLCERTRFTVRGPWKRFHHCHCSRCRKKSGGAHSTTLFVAAGQLSFLGEEGTHQIDFCRACGSPLPRPLDGGQTWGVPAGSLDESPSIRPQARIFWGSRAPWSCAADDVPTFEEW